VPAGGGPGRIGTGIAEAIYGALDGRGGE